MDSLTIAIHHILEVIHESKDLKCYRRDKSKYCEFYKDHDHNINNCIAQKNEIENPILRGKQSKFVENGKSENQRDKQKPRRC